MLKFVMLYMLIGCAFCASSPWERVASSLVLAGGHRSSARGNEVIEFGGTIEDVTQTNPLLRFVSFSASLRAFSLSSKEWRYLNFASEPSARAFHVQGLICNKLHIVGGFAGFFHMFADHHVCDLDTGECVLLTSSVPFGSRVGSASAVIGDTLYIYGGNNIDFSQPNPIVVYGDLWSYTDINGWNLMNTSGSIPQRRTNAYSFVRENKFCIFGGEDNASGPLSYLNMTIYCNDVSTGIWSVVSSVNVPRTFAFAACAYDSVYDSLVCQGGDFGLCDRDLLTSQLTMFKFREYKWFSGVLPDYLSGPVSKRATLTLLNRNAIHSGGYSSSSGYKDDVVCTMQQTYINSTYIYHLNNLYAVLP